jgi:hypothetical protein
VDPHSDKRNTKEDGVDVERPPRDVESAMAADDSAKTE